MQKKKRQLNNEKMRKSQLNSNIDEIQTDITNLNNATVKYATKNFTQTSSDYYVAYFDDANLVINATLVRGSSTGTTNYAYCTGIEYMTPCSMLLHFNVEITGGTIAYIYI